MTEKNQSTGSTIESTTPQDNNDDETVLAPQKTEPSASLPEPEIIETDTITPMAGVETHDLLATNVTAQAEQESPNIIKPGSTLNNRFDILEVIGSGGMGTVYKALDKRDVEAGNSRFIAIKVLNDECQNSAHLLKALYEETKRTQSLAHQNIVTVYDFDRQSNLVYMTMELIDGAPLNKIIKRNPSGINITDSLDIINQIAQALSYAHGKHIIHLDLKPNNIYIDHNKCVKILDFGISQKLNASLADNTEPTPALGLTPSYASIEILNDEPASISDDIYAFACICYEILTGKHPYNKERADIAYAKKLAPQKIKSLNSAQWTALKHALALKKEDRTASIDQFIKAFNKKPTKAAPFILGGVAVVLSAFAYLYFQTDSKTKGLPSGLQHSINGALNKKTTPAVQKRESISASKQTIEAALKEPLTIKEQGKINIWLNKTSYKIGDTLQINFTVDKASYLRLFIINSAGEFSPVFPNPFQPENLLDADKTYQIPPAGAQFTLDIGPPKGRDKIIAFASSKPIAEDTIKADASGNIIENDLVRSYIKYETSYIIE